MNRIRVVQIEVVGYQITSINCKKRHHYCREFRSIDDFILRNWGACVDTVFGHVSMIGKVWIGKMRWCCLICRVSCRWRMVADGGAVERD